MILDRQEGPSYGGAVISLFLDRDEFHHSFAADIPAQQAMFFADAQVPWGVEALSATSPSPRGGRKRAGTWSRPGI